MSVTTSTESSEFWPLRLVLRRKRIERGLWDYDSWDVESVDSERGQDSRPVAVESLPITQNTAAGVYQDYLWRGLRLELFRDERAAYRFNLAAEQPRLFVICCTDEVEGYSEPMMRPFVISASQDVAASYMDGGEEDVFSLPMPPAVQCWIEAFIALHGEPDLGLSKGKRRRYRDGRKLEAADE